MNVKEKVAYLYGENIDLKDFDGLIDIFKQEDKADMICEKIFGNRMVLRQQNPKDGDEAEMMIRFFPNNALTVARMAVNHKNQGIGSKIIQYLIDYCRSKKLSRLIIECVLTDEMVRLCEKFNFKEDKFVPKNFNLDL